MNQSNQLEEKSILILEDLRDQIEILNEALMQNDRTYVFEINVLSE